MTLGPLRFDCFGRSAEVPLRSAFFFLLGSLAENIFVLGVGLREVVVTKALTELQLTAAFSVSLDNQLDTPLDFGRRTLPPAAKILVVLDLELANIPLELT